jgi:mannose-6-phosphate isomerase-like protein (cupin superfamily)
MKYTPINFKQKFILFDEYWSPKIIAQMNDYQFKVAKIKGEFIWHSHRDTDETFIVMDGSMHIHFREGSVSLNPGEMFVVPQGIEHKPVADEECQILMIELAGTVNTGEIRNARTKNEGEWI